MRKLMTVIGATVAGFAAGILVAPKSGRETRNDIKNKVDEIKAETDKKADQAKQVAQDSAKSVKAGLKKVGEATVETAQDIKDSVEKRF